jgi:hypothetical protein
MVVPLCESEMLIIKVVVACHQCAVWSKYCNHIRRLTICE